MRGVRIPQDLNGEDHFVLGLSVPRLAALLLGLLAAYTILHLSLPAPVQLSGAALAGLIGALVAWVRPEGRSLLHWLAAAMEFRFAGDNDAVPKRRERDSTGSSDPPLVQSVAVQRQPRLQLVGEATSPSAARVTNVMTVVGDDDVVELPELPVGHGFEQQPNGPSDGPIAAPVYLGGPQVITFFSTKGGTGRTTLATEVATLLALKGRYRESASGGVERLRVALVDFDLASANVSARLGLAQPTMLDYLCDATVQSPDPGDFVIHQSATNLDVLLGPSKCLAGDRADLMGVAQAARILSSFKEAGYQFLVIDISASLGDLETYLLEAANQIYCVVTPTAGSVQSLYRGVEALRRLGLANKLHYVANKMREGVNLAEAMGDLNGSLAASVPYDPLFDTAENQHQPLVLHHVGPTAMALTQVAASIYPALEVPVRTRSGVPAFGWFMRRRRAG